MQSLTALYGESYGVGLFTRGLPEFEPVPEDDQVTLALTLLRSVGWLNKQAGIATPGAQVPGTITAEFMLQQLPADPNPPALLKQSQVYRAPLQARQYDEKPPQPEQSYLQLDDERVLLTAFKAPQDGSRGWIVRLMNPTQRDIGVNLIPHGTLDAAARLNMAEDTQETCTIQNNHVNVALRPHDVATFRLQFSEMAGS
jgi:alpha-mannosidase